MWKWKKIRRKIRYRFIYASVQLMIFISNLMPRVIWLRFCGKLGSLAYLLASHSRKLTIQHLTVAFSSEKNVKEIQKMAREVFVSIGKNAGDIIRACKIHDFPSFERIRKTNGMENAERAFAKRKGVIFLTAHIGAFEFIGTELAFQGYKPMIIGAPMKDEKLNRLLWEQRNKFGASTIEMGKETMRIMKTLKRGGTLIILIDQDIRVKSVFINFFEKPCATPIGATLFALKTGAAIVPIFYHLRRDGLQEVNCYPEVEMTITGSEENDLIINTQKLIDIVEVEIRKYPSQWVWMHERWKTKPGEEIRY